MRVQQIETRPHLQSNGESTERVLNLLGLPRKESFWDRFFKWERHITVANKVIEKGLVITPQMGLGIVLAFLTALGGMYWRTTDKIDSAKESQTKEMQAIRDMMIETKTRLDERSNYQKEAESKRERDQEAARQLDQVWRETMSQRMSKLEVGRAN